MGPFGSRRSLERLIDLQQETNSLLRELLITLGRKPTTRPPDAPRPRLYSDADVFRVTRATVLEQEAKAERELQQGSAPTTPAGPAGGTTPKTSGAATNSTPSANFPAST